MQTTILNEAWVKVEVTTEQILEMEWLSGKKSAGNDVREIPRTLDNSPENIWNLMQMPNNICMENILNTRYI